MQKKSNYFLNLEHEVAQYFYTFWLLFWSFAANICSFCGV